MIHLSIREVTSWRVLLCPVALSSLKPASGSLGRLMRGLRIISTATILDAYTVIDDALTLLHLKDILIFQGGEDNLASSGLRNQLRRSEDA